MQLSLFVALSSCCHTRPPDPIVGSDAGRNDAAVDVVRDAGRPDAPTLLLSDAGADAPDAPAPRPLDACPAASDEYEVVPLGPVADLAGGKPALGGDGSTVVLAVRPEGDDGTFVFRIAPTGDASLLGVVDGVSGARVSVDDGVARMIGVVDGADELVLYETDGGAFLERGRTRVERAGSMALDRPVWNGDDVVLSSSTGFLGPFVIGGESDGWRDDDAGRFSVAQRPEPGLVEVLEHTRVGYRLRALGASGELVAGSDAVLPVAPLELAVFGWTRGSSTGLPIVLGGTKGDAAHRTFAVYRVDAAGLGTETFTIDASDVTAIDLATTAMAPHDTGYGVVLERNGESALFHGTIDDGPPVAIDLGAPCASPSIAAGPCGWVIACHAAHGVELSLVVPPATP